MQGGSLVIIALSTFAQAFDGYNSTIFAYGLLPSLRWLPWVRSSTGLVHH